MKDLHTGRVSASVSELLTMLGSKLPGFTHVLVRELDSTREPTELRRILRRYGLEAIVRADGALLECRHASSIVESGCLAGFDELWFLTAAPSTAPVIRPDWVLSPLAVDLRRGAPVELRDSLRRTPCALAVADGLGMNFATTDAQLAEALHSTFEVHSGD